MYVLSCVFLTMQYTNNTLTNFSELSVELSLSLLNLSLSRYSSYKTLSASAKNV